MKGSKCSVIFSRILYLFCLVFVCFFSFFFPLFGSSPVSALTLVNDVRIVGTASDPYVSWNGGAKTRNLFQPGSDGVTSISIYNDDGNGFRMAANDYFIFYLEISSAKTSNGDCKALASTDFKWTSNLYTVLSMEQMSHQETSNLCYTSFEITAFTWNKDDWGQPFRLEPEFFFAQDTSSTYKITGWQHWRPYYQSGSTGGDGTGAYDKEILDAIKQSGEYQKQQAENTEKIKDFITDTKEPDAGDIATSDSLPSVGLLPPGPLDSILLLPLNIMNSILSSLGGSCTPITAPLPFVDQNLTFPCFGDTIYTGDFAPLANIVGGVASAFILYGYFKHLYKKVDRAVSLETSEEDEWGVL